MSRKLTDAEYSHCIKERLCFCGSMKPKEAAYDARNIFLNYVCDECREEKLSEYRKDVLSDPNYWHDEEIDGE